jgi:hypothetical protein
LRGEEGNRSLCYFCSYFLAKNMSREEGVACGVHGLAGDGFAHTRGYPSGTSMGKAFCPRVGLRVGEGWGCGYTFGQANAIPALVRLAAITSYHKGILLWSSNL